MRGARKKLAGAVLTRRKNPDRNLLGGKNVSARVIALLFTLFFLGGAPARAQLGPKDGRDLAPTDLNRIKVGQAAPDFTLEAVDGKPVALSDFRGKKNVVLVFYRGFW
jgi:cytochrome oxidase Cu insertion factor (SCO1/SenC/PrrC family)